MKYKRIDCITPNTLIHSFYELELKAEDIPLMSSVIPTALSHILHVDSEKAVEANNQNEVFQNIGTVVIGQSYKTYKLLAKSTCYNFGINFHPTALYKLTGSDLSELSNKHKNLSEVNKRLYDTLHPLFLQKKEAPVLSKLIEEKINELTIIEDRNTKIIDEAIDLIFKRRGLISVDEILKKLPISQKNLQIQFKKMVGLTPIKFIKLNKFLSMIKYMKKKKISITELIDTYNYYDLSHFTKDFKLFMGQTPSEYFDTDNKFSNNYLNN